MVGTSGSAKLRFKPPTPIALSLPERTWAMVEGTEANDIWLSPPITSISAGPAPRNGTWTMSTPAISLNSTGPRCMKVPTPDEAYLSSPGLALARATSSWTEWNGSWALMDSTLGAVARIAIGANAASVSYGIL